MNKIYQRIDWENYPSSATPLNEDNLNKMDYAIDKLDDRIVTHETTKLNTATGNTLVKNVTFNEKTGVFTIEKLSGSKITINTALEKIATNFRYDYSTQKLILTLIDGTTQEVDLSALLTQYEFLNSSTIQFTIDSSGKVKASVVNGSITGNMLEPNYLANVTLQAKNAKTSADNAKTSEELAYQYAEEAKESASQTAKSDAKNITYDNTESGLSATNVKDALDEVAQCSVSAIATDTTITDSTNAPLVRLKVKGKTEQFTTSGKNLLNTSELVEEVKNGVTYTPVYDENGMLQYINCNGTSDTTESLYVIYMKSGELPTTLKKGIEYIASANSTGKVNIQVYEYINNKWSNIVTTNTSKSFVISENATGLFVRLQVLTKETSVSNVKCYPMIRLATVTDDTYEPYTGGVASPNPDYPQEIKCIDKVSVKTCGKNLLKNTATTQTIKGVTYAVNKDGSVTLNGTATEWGFFNLNYNNANTRALPSGDYIVSGGTINARVTILENSKSLASNLGGETNFSISSASDNNWCRIDIFAGTFNNVTIYPMIRLASITDSTYEPYTETVAEFDLSEPLYEGDYIEYRADGTGVLHRKMAKVVFDGSSDEDIKIGTSSGVNNYAFIVLSDAKANNYSTVFSTHYKATGNASDTQGSICVNATNSLIMRDYRFATATEYKTWLQSNPVTVVYELAEPTETPLTAEQVAEFKKLYTFEPVTNVLCDGETEIQYYKNTTSGVAIATVHKKTLLVENTTVDVFTDTLGEWNSISINNDVTLRGITYGNGKLVAVGDDGAVYYSEDNGETWSTANASQTMYSVTYGNGLFVAVSADDFCTSPDGITWTVRKEVGDVLYSVTYGGDKKLFVAFGTEYADGNYTLHNYYSPDGINWYSAEIGYFTEAYCNVKYIPEEGIFLGVCGVHTFSSSDGISFSAIGVCESTSKLQSITCGNGMYVAIDDNGDIFYNANPTSVSIWTRGASLGVALYDVIFKNGLFIAVGAIRATYYSEYGMSWNSFGTGVTGSGDLYSITYNHGKFIAVGGNGSIFAVEYSKESKNLQDAINELYLQLK